MAQVAQIVMVVQIALAGYSIHILGSIGCYGRLSRHLDKQELSLYTNEGSLESINLYYKRANSECSIAYQVPEFVAMVGWWVVDHLALSVTFLRENRRRVLLRVDSCSSSCWY